MCTINSKTEIKDGNRNGLKHLFKDLSLNAALLIRLVHSQGNDDIENLTYFLGFFLIMFDLSIIQIKKLVLKNPKNLNRFPFCWDNLLYK